MSQKDTDQRAHAANGVRYLPLCIVLFLGFYLLAAPFFGNTFYLQRPSNLLAGDAYWHLFILGSVIEVGNYNFEPDALEGFTGEKLAPVEPPLVFYYSAFLANLLGIPSYVALQFGLLLGISLAFSAVYILFARYDFRLATAISPFFIIALSYPFIAGITWGFWKAYLSFLLFFFSLLLFPVRFTNGSLCLYALLLAAIMLSHPAIMPYAVIVLLLKVWLTPEDRTGSGLLKAAGVLAAAAALSVMFLLNYSKREGVSGATLAGKVPELLGYAPDYHLFGATPFAAHFGVVWPLSLLGFALAVYFMLKLMAEKKYLFRILALFSFLFLVFFMPLLGFGRVYQFRLVWPVVVSVFAGLPAYVLLRPVAKGRAWPFFAAFLVALYALLSFGGLALPEGNSSLFTDEAWSAYKFVAEKTPQSSKVLIVDPVLTQDALVFYTKRYTRFLDYSSFEEMARDGTPIEEKEKKMLCSLAETTRKNEITKKACEARKMRPCEFDYLLLNLQVRGEGDLKLMNGFLQSLGNRYGKVAGGQQAIVLENSGVCKNGA